MIMIPLGYLTTKFTFNMKKILLIVMCCIISILTHSQKKTSTFRDTIDNAIDLSKFLTEKKGVLPIPTIITEPAVGLGAGLAIGYFHGSILETGNIPDITVAFGGFTDNGTWFGGMAHKGYWKQDRIRYTGLLAKSYINIDYYGPNNVLDDPIEMNLDTWIFLQQIKFRFKQSDFFVGARYFLYDGINTLELPIDIPEYTGSEFSSTLSEVSLMVDYDTRDNVFSPSKGFYAHVAGTYSDEWLGGPDLYGRLKGVLLGFGELSEKATVGVRIETLYASENTPFWAIPSITMRGVPAAKFQGNNVNVLEAQLNYKLNYRWEMVGFTGIGTTAPVGDGWLETSQSVRTVGAGVRYMMARVFGLNAGMDLAWSADDFGFYFVVGHAWAR